MAETKRYQTRPPIMQKLQKKQIVTVSQSSTVQSLGNSKLETTYRKYAPTNNLNLLQKPSTFMDTFNKLESNGQIVAENEDKKKISIPFDKDSNKFCISENKNRRQEGAIKDLKESTKIQKQVKNENLLPDQEDTPNSKQLSIKMSEITQGSVQLANNKVNRRKQLSKGTCFYKIVLQEPQLNHGREKPHNILEEFKAKEREFVNHIEKFERLYIRKFELNEKYCKFNYLTEFKKLLKENKKFLNDIEKCEIADDIGKLLCEEKTLKTLFESIILWSPLEDSVKNELEEIFNNERKEDENLSFVYYLQLPNNKAFSSRIFLENLIKTEKKENRSVKNLQVALERIKESLSYLNNLYAVRSIKKIDFSLSSDFPCLGTAGFYNKKDVHYQLFLFKRILVFTQYLPEKYTYESKIEIKDLSFILKDSEYYEFSNKTVKYLLRAESYDTEKFLVELTDMIVDREKGLLR